MLNSDITVNQTIPDFISDVIVSNVTDNSNSTCPNLTFSIYQPVVKDGPANVFKAIISPQLPTNASVDSLFKFEIDGLTSPENFTYNFTVLQNNVMQITVNYKVDNLPLGTVVSLKRNDLDNVSPSLLANI